MSLVKQKEGFTLFELLIAIFIGTIIIFSGAYAIRMGLFSLEKEEAWFNDSTKEKAVFDFFWQQVSSIRIEKIPDNDTLLSKESIKAGKKNTIYFRGEKDSLSFVSPLSFNKHYSQGLVITNYKIKVNDNGLWNLIYSEIQVNPMALTTFSKESEGKLLMEFRMNKEHTILLKDCSSISFSYLDTKKDVETIIDDEGGEINTETDISSMIPDAEVIEGTDLLWKEKITTRIPRAIKLLVSKNGKEQELIAPIMVTYSSLVYGQ